MPLEGVCGAEWWHISYRQGTLARDASHLRLHFMCRLTEMLLLFVGSQPDGEICARLSTSLITHSGDT